MTSLQAGRVNISLSTHSIFLFSCAKLLPSAFITFVHSFSYFPFKT